MKKIKVGITGQSGFVGTHLYNWLKLNEKFELVDFEDKYFEDKNVFEDFVSNCDAIVHLAAMNRHKNKEVIYDTNIKLVKQLVDACEATNSKPHILFSSSTQEERDNLYGKSKEEGRTIFETWAAQNNTSFTGLIIPNVFGAFGKPNYNSVIATFCHKLNNNETPEIHIDGEMKLIYVNKLIDEIKIKILDQVNSKEQVIEKYLVPHQYESKVKDVLAILNQFKEKYLEKGVFPDLSNNFEKDLFNTFRTYVKNDHYPFQYTKHTDNRGAFVEIARTNSAGQFSFSTTVPGITRGNHFHTRKAERFAVIKGKARIQLRHIGTDKVINYDLDGENPAFVDMPIWTTHNIINTGDEELVTLFWINEPFDSNDPDTYFEIV
ncbi:MAG: NAD-dependent epimerase/dehydratase family protein [Bacteroidota bacterium]